MNSSEFLEQIISYFEQYKEWQQPINYFISSYFKEHKNIGKVNVDNFEQDLQEFTHKLQAENNLPERINSFLDQHFNIYLSFSQEECEKIISSFDGHREFGSFLFNYAQRAIAQLQETGDKTWLLRGLIATSLENCGIDIRDTYEIFSDLFEGAKKHGINPKESFYKVAMLSSRNKPRAWHTSSVSEMMMGFARSANDREQRMKEINE